MAFTSYFLYGSQNFWMVQVSIASYAPTTSLTKKKYENSKDTKCSTTPFPMLIRDYNQLTLVELLPLLYGQQEPRQYINFLI